MLWGALLIVARLLQFAGALAMLGTSLFCVYGAAAGNPLPTRQRWRWLRPMLVIAALSAMAGTVLWVMAETVLFSGDPADGTRLSAVWVVFSETRFGRVCLLRVGLLALALAAACNLHRHRAWLPVHVALAVVILATFAWTGHGAMGSGWAGALHLGGNLAHLWVAGIWLGALPPLLMLVWQARRSAAVTDASAALYGLERFSSIGSVVMAILIISGLINSAFLIGLTEWRTALSSDYGLTLLIKLGLFACMLGLAAANRFWLSPRLRAQSDTAATLQMLGISIATEIALAVLVLLAVGVLGTLAPPASD